MTPLRPLNYGAKPAPTAILKGLPTCRLLFQKFPDSRTSELRWPFATPVDGAQKEPCCSSGGDLERRSRYAYVADMRILVLRRLLIVLTGLAFLVGAAVQAMPSAEFMASACMGAAKTATGDCCANMAMKDHPAPLKQVPCKGISLDCAKEFGCISTPALPAPSTALGSPTVYGRVAYWPPATSRAGLSIKPDLFPPIANRIAA
jgi:hypothetical protein